MAFKDAETKRAYQREHYRKNRDRYLARKQDCQAIVRSRLKQIVLEAKGSQCRQCLNEFPPWVLQFDHVTGDKQGNVCDMIMDCVSDQKLKLEIAKCEVVCANCHADRTYKRRNNTGV